MDIQNDRLLEDILLQSQVGVFCCFFCFDPFSVTICANTDEATSRQGLREEYRTSWGPCSAVRNPSFNASLRLFYLEGLVEFQIKNKQMNSNNKKTLYF